MMFVALSGLDLFFEIFSQFKGINEVVAVSTDAGGAKFTVHYSDAMDIPYAIANKFRPGKDRANLLGITGNLKDKRVAIITDDETVTGSSIINATRWLYTNGIHKIYVGVSHMKLRKEFLPALLDLNKNFGLEEFHTTDTIPQVSSIKELNFIKIHSLARRFALTINHLHYNQSVSELYRVSEQKFQ
jgi:ribose-phosphate pyrophosphokinase